MKGISLVALVVLAAIGVGIGVESVTPLPPITGPFASFGNDAGYYSPRRPVSVSAQWRVPTILAHSAPGYALTWIGIEGGANRFIQVGTLEIRSNSPGRPEASGYFIFWSDIDHGYKPQVLAAVHAGDPVKAAITKDAKGWSLGIDDARLAVGNFSVNVGDPTSGFDVADWLQEDPIRLASNGQFLPYPKLSSVSFREMRINGDAPELSLSRSAWLTVGGTNYAPRPRGEDGFDLAAAHLDRSQLQFLADSEPLSATATRADLELDKLDANASARQRAATAAPFFAAVRRFAREIPLQAWPARALPALRRLTAADELYGAVGDAASQKAQEAEAASVNDGLAARLALGIAQNARTSYDVGVSLGS